MSTYNDCVNTKLEIDEILRKEEPNIKTPSVHEAMQNYLDQQNFIKTSEKSRICWISNEIENGAPLRDYRNYIVQKPSNWQVDLITPVIFSSLYSSGEINFSQLNLSKYKYYYLNSAYTYSRGIDAENLSKLATQNGKDLLAGTSGCVLLEDTTNPIQFTSYSYITIFGSNSLLPPNSPPRAYHGSLFTPIDCDFKLDLQSKKYTTITYTPNSISEL